MKIGQVHNCGVFYIQAGAQGYWVKGPGLQPPILRNSEDEAVLLAEAFDAIYKKGMATAILNSSAVRA